MAMAGVLSMAAVSMAAYAGTWHQTGNDWMYQNDDTTWAVAGWEWIDGKCYYFDQAGRCYMNSAEPTPDGYYVDASGAWVVNGVVQTQSQPAASSTIQSGETSEAGAELLGRWHRVEEYNTTGVTGENAEKYIVVQRAGDQLKVESYRGSARRPSVSSMLAYENPYWTETATVFDTPFRYYVEEETGRLIAFMMSKSGWSAYVEEYERAD